MPKTCIRCNQPKDKFRPGYAICYDCVLEDNRKRYHARYKSDPDFIENKKKYADTHKEKSRLDNKIWRAQNRKVILEKQKNYRARNQDRRNKREETQRLDNKLKLIQLFGGKCLLCGYNLYHGALEFHHKSSEPKSFDISKKFSVRSEKGWNELLTEAKKCVLICSNCHREVHAGLKFV